MITDKTTATATESYTSIDTPFNSLHAKNNAGEALKNGVFSAIEKEQQVIGVVGAQKRDKLYSLLLSDYITELKTDKLINRKLKYFTFIIMMLVFSLLTVGLVGFVAFLSIKGVGNDTADIVLSVSCFASIITAFVGLPSIITKHLFPEKSENDTVKIMRELIKNDIAVRQSQTKIVPSNKPKK